MKKSKLILLAISAFFNQTWGMDEGNRHAFESCEIQKQKMVATGLLTPDERLALDQEESRIKARIEAVLNGDKTREQGLILSFQAYVERFASLSQEADRRLNQSCQDSPTQIP